MRQVLRNRSACALYVACAALLVAACSNDIWNAGDLAAWVRDRAVEQGCERDSVELEDWYRTEAGKNNWYGSCVSRGDGEKMTFAINVDTVWTPSGGG